VESGEGGCAVGGSGGFFAENGLGGEEDVQCLRRGWVLLRFAVLDTQGGSVAGGWLIISRRRITISTCFTLLYILLTCPIVLSNNIKFEIIFVLT
jgi:hypothetical protein